MQEALLVQFVDIKKQTLLKSVAESTVIFFPIFQLGCFNASATLTSFSLSTGKSLSITEG